MLKTRPLPTISIMLLWGPASIKWINFLTRCLKLKLKLKLNAFHWNTLSLVSSAEKYSFSWLFSYLYVFLYTLVLVKFFFLVVIAKYGITYFLSALHLLHGKPPPVCLYSRVACTFSHILVECRFLRSMNMQILSSEHLTQYHENSDWCCMS
jgi:hypothetical protein